MLPLEWQGARHSLKPLGESISISTCLWIRVRLRGQPQLSNCYWGDCLLDMSGWEIWHQGQFVVIQYMGWLLTGTDMLSFVENVAKQIRQYALVLVTIFGIQQHSSTPYSIMMTLAHPSVGIVGYCYQGLILLTPDGMAWTIKPHPLGNFMVQWTWTIWLDRRMEGWGSKKRSLEMPIQNTFPPPPCFFKCSNMGLTKVGDTSSSMQ